VNAICLSDLQRLIQDWAGIPLMDVRLEEDFAVGHIAGAKNACVFKVSFLDDVAQLGVTKDERIVVYGTMEQSHESRVAAEKLGRAGYSQVLDFRGGLREWVEGNGVVEGTRQAPPAEPLNGRFAVNLAESRIEWTGRNLLNKHSGTIGLKSGHLMFKEDALVGGDFVLDVNAMTCGDIQDGTTNQVLIDHLKSDDFWDAANHPEARYQIREVHPFADATPGSANMRINGDFTLRGCMNPLGFLAVLGRTAGGRPAAQAVFAFDRTLWGSIYGSGKFFASLGMHLVNDLVEVQVRLVA
jgi:rhodanese-related sulfurtransferase